jgi:hypothetical protein
VHRMAMAIVNTAYALLLAARRERVAAARA